MSAPLAKIRDVYGDEYLVARADLDGSRQQLPLYWSNGVKRSEHAHRMGWSQLGHTIHRGNIAEVLPS